MSFEDLTQHGPSLSRTRPRAQESSGTGWLIATLIGLAAALTATAAAFVLLRPADPSRPKSVAGTAAAKARARAAKKVKPDVEAAARFITMEAELEDFPERHNEAVQKIDDAQDADDIPAMRNALQAYMDLIDGWIVAVRRMDGYMKAHPAMPGHREASERTGARLARLLDMRDGAARKGNLAIARTELAIAKEKQARLHRQLAVLGSMSGAERRAAVRATKRIDAVGWDAAGPTAQRFAYLINPELATKLAKEAAANSGVLDYLPDGWRPEGMRKTGGRTGTGRRKKPATTAPPKPAKRDPAAEKAAAEAARVAKAKRAALDAERRKLRAAQAAEAERAAALVRAEERKKAIANIPTLVAGLGVFRTRDASVLALGKIGVPAVPALMGALSSADGETRRLAAMTLGHIGAEAKAALPALRKIADGDEDSAVREAALKATERVADEK